MLPGDVIQICNYCFDQRLLSCGRGNESPFRIDLRIDTTLPNEPLSYTEVRNANASALAASHVLPFPHAMVCRDHPALVVRQQIALLL